MEKWLVQQGSNAEQLPQISYGRHVTTQYILVVTVGFKKSSLTFLSQYTKDCVLPWHLHTYIHVGMLCSPVLPSSNVPCPTVLVSSLLPGSPHLLFHVICTLLPSLKYITHAHMYAHTHVRAHTHPLTHSHTDTHIHTIVKMGKYTLFHWRSLLQFRIQKVLGHISCFLYFP